MLPKNVREIRVAEKAGGRDRARFAGGVGPRSVYFYLAKANRCHEVSLPELVRAAAAAAGETPAEILEWLKSQLVAPSGPSGPDRNAVDAVSDPPGPPGPLLS